MAAAPDSDSGPDPTAPASGRPVRDLRDTLRLTPDAATPGRLHGVIDEGWAIAYAFGGVTMAVSAQAATDVLARPDLDLVSMSTTFVSAVPCGPIGVDAVVLRNGGRAAQAGVDLRAGGAADLGVRSVATFGRRSPDAKVAYVAAEFPADVADPDDCPDDAPPPGVTGRWGWLRFNDQHESRIAIGAPFWDRSRDPAPARAAWWTRMRIPVRTPDGRIDPVAYCVPADFLGPAVGLPLGADAPEAFVLSLQIDLHVIASTTSDWILRDAQILAADDGFVSGTTTLWDRDRRLIGHATQRANLRVITADDQGAFGPR